MSAGVRLAAFAGLLAVVLGVAALVGGAAEPDSGSESASKRSAVGEQEGHAGHGAPRNEVVAGTVPGLGVADGGLTLEIVRGDVRPGAAGTLAFRITGEDGTPLSNFEVEHEKRMHLIVVRRDGTGFQHLHPAMDDDGVWSTPLTLAQPGSYRVFADFKSRDEARTLAADLNVSGRATYEPLPQPAATFTTTTGYDVALERGNDDVLRFTVTRDGPDVHPEPYLGAGGHLVALREGDLAYLHTHPVEAGEHGDGGHGGGHGDGVAFETTFPSDGHYRLYFQFKHDGRVHTAEFTVQVRR